MSKKQIEVDGKTYTLVENRETIVALQKIAPEYLKQCFDLAKNVDTEKENNIENFDIEKSVNVAMYMYIKAPLVLHELLKLEHPEISIDDAVKIMDKLIEKYGNGASAEIFSFAMNSFMQGSQVEQKSIWKK